MKGGAWYGSLTGGALKRSLAGSSSVAALVLGLALATPAAAQIVGTDGTNGSSPGAGGAGGTASFGGAVGDGGTGGNGGNNASGTAGGGALGGAPSPGGGGTAGGGGADSGGGGGSASTGTGGGGGGGGGRGATIDVPGGSILINAAVGGGNGGDGGNGVGATAPDGGGGGGGANAVVLTNGVALTLNGVVTGGNGGVGGTAGQADGWDGSGGAGGNGLVTTIAVPINVNFAITGGTGGTSGNLSGGGNGGAGGSGIVTTVAGATLNINAAVTGGNGGAALADGAIAGHGVDGAGGIGIAGGGLTVNLGATVAGGLSGDGVTRNFALSSTGTSFLNLNTGFGIVGGINIGGGTLQVTPAANATLGNVISGAGALIVAAGSNTLTLNSASTYTGGTTITSGTVAIGNVAALGTGNVRFNAGTLLANVTGTLANNIQVNAGGGLKIIAGDGQTLTQTGAMSLGNNVSSLSFGQANGTGLVVLGAIFGSFTGAANFSVDALGGTTRGTTNVLGFFTGSATATNIASGATVEYLSTGVNDSRIRNLQAAGAVIIGTGANLLIGGGQSTGAITGGGALSLTTATFASGLLTLTGTNTYTGGTSIAAGTTLSLGTGGATGSIVGNVANSGTLAFNRSNAVQFDGVVSGTGALQKTGAGALNLTAVNTYTGNTTVNAGLLAVNGSTASSALTTVNAGATLGGNGTVGNTTINGGTLAPGNSIGTLTVAGNLILSAAASYMVEVSPTNADRTNVTGNATLGGATVNANFAAGTYVEKKYTILNAGSISGTFGSVVNTNLPFNFKTALSYDPTNAYLDLSLVFVAPPGTGLNINQQNVGNAITNFFNTNGGIPLAFGALTPAGLTQVSGEVGTASQQGTFNAMNQFMGVMTDPFIAGRGDPVGGGGNPNAYAEEGSLAYAAKRKPNDALAAIYTKAPPIVQSFEQRWSVWAAAFGGSQRTDGNTIVGSNNTSSSLYGTAVGADYRLSPNTIAGFALAGGGTNFSVANNLGGGRSDLFQAGAFIRHNVGPAYISAALAYGWQDITTDRTVTVAGVDRLRAQFNANAWSGRVEGGYRFVAQGFGWTPYAAGQFTTFDLPAYAEQAIVGSNQFALAYNSKSVTDSRSELGLRTDKSFAMTNAILTLRGRAAWAHDFNPNRAIGATFQTLPGASFFVNGAAMASDAALVTGAAELKWINGWSAAATFEGEFSNVTRSYAGKGVVRYAW